MIKGKLFYNINERYNYIFSITNTEAEAKTLAPAEQWNFKIQIYN